MATVCIEEKAFMTMLVAAVEAFPSKYRPDAYRKPKGVSAEGEVHGLLFGQLMDKGDKRIYNVTLAVPNQIVYDRNENGVKASMVHIDRIREITELFPTYQFLGWFHSHPYKHKDFHKKTSVEFSEVDRQSAVEMASDLCQNMIEIIFGLTCLKRMARTKPEFIGTHIIHNCCGIYKYSLACYITQHATVRVESLFLAVDNLICPTGAGMHYSDFLNKS